MIENNLNIETNGKQRKRKLFIAHSSKKHCKEDRACDHCCTCWLTHKKQYEIRLNNFQSQAKSLKSQIIFLKQLNQKLMSQMTKAKASSNPEVLKQNIKLELQEKLREQKQVEDAIREQKIQQLENCRKNYELQLVELRKNKKENIEEIERLKASNQRLEELVENSEEKSNKYKKEAEELADIAGKLREQGKSMNKIVEQKTRTVGKLMERMNQIEGMFLRQKNRADNFSGDKEVLEMNMKYKDDYIEALTKCTESNLKSLGSLQENNRKLQNLVEIMDLEIVQKFASEKYLKDRLLGAEEKLVWAQSLARISSQKVQMMKTDLHALKMTI